MGAVEAVTKIPTGQSAPFARLTDDDHRAWIIIASAIGVSFTMLALISRTFIRFFVLTGWGLDDSLTIVSTIFHLIQSSLVMVACANGLGASAEKLNSEQQALLQLTYYVSNLFYVLALDTSKVVSILFVYRLTSRGTQIRHYTKLVATLLPVSTLALILMVALQCSLPHPWILSGQDCPDWFLRWKIHAAVASVAEVAIFIAPLRLLWTLQLPKSVKVDIAIPFALRLLIVVLTGFRIWSFDSSAFKTNPTLGEATYIVFTQAELTYSLLASTFPSTRRFVVDLVTYYNNGQFVGKDHSRGRDDPMGKDIQMMALKSKATGADRQSGGTNSGNDGDDSSQTGIIKKTVSYDVVSERASVHAGRSDSYEIPYFGI